MTNPMFFFNDTATTEIYTLSLHDALPIYIPRDVEREILNRFSGSGKERRQQVEDAKEAYVRLQNKAYDSNIPKEDLERSEEHTSELQSRQYLACRLLLEKKHGPDFSLSHH